VAHQAAAYPGFGSMKSLFELYFYSPLDGMPVHRRVDLNILFSCVGDESKQCAGQYCTTMVFTDLSIMWSLFLLSFPFFIFFLFFYFFIFFLIRKNRFMCDC